MSKQRIRNKENYEMAIHLERQGQLHDALKLLQKVTVTDPLHELAWSRSMVILRKLKKGEDEVKLIKSAIASYKKATNESQKHWIQENKKKAQLTKELAKTLGLLGKNGLPDLQNETLERWETRLYLLTHRLANAKLKAEKKKNSTQKAPATNQPKKASNKKKSISPKNKIPKSNKVVSS